MHRDKRPWSVCRARGSKLASHWGLTKHLTNIMASPYPFAEGTTKAPFSFKGIPEWMAWLRRNPPSSSSSSQCPGAPSLPPTDMLFWSSAVSTSQTHNPKSTDPRDGRKDQGKGVTHKDQTTKWTSAGTLSLVPGLAPGSAPPKKRSLG